MSLKGTNHLLSGGQITPEVFSRISQTARDLRERERLDGARQTVRDLHPLGASGIALFKEPSSRTRYSFIRASNRLEVPLEQEANMEVTLSLAKKENMPDTIRTFNALGYDFIVIRSPNEDDVKDAASVSLVPVLNAGDGKGEHPTQAALDMDTMMEVFGSLEGLRVVFAGDAEGARVVHSLEKALSMVKDTRLIFSSIPELSLSDEYIADMDRRKVNYQIIPDIKEAISEADVLYISRFQGERQPSEGLKKEQLEQRNRQLYRKYLEHTTVEGSVLSILEEKGVRVMHAGPRNEELPESLTNHPQVLFLRQMEKGVDIRTAIIYLALTQTLFRDCVQVESL